MCFSVCQTHVARRAPNGKDPLARNSRFPPGRKFDLFYCTQGTRTIYVKSQNTLPQHGHLLPTSRGSTHGALISIYCRFAKFGLGAYCQSLALKQLPEGITEIGNDAFFGCTELALTKLPDGLTKIGKFAFYQCERLALKQLPEGITGIGNEAFSGCTGLALTKLPEGLTEIGNRAFFGCTGLALTKLPEGLTEIGERAFSGCTQLVLTTLPDSLQHVAESAFAQCSKQVQNLVVQRRLTVHKRRMSISPPRLP